MTQETTMSLPILFRALAAGALLSLLVPSAQAERADRDKPVNIDADRMTVDDHNKVNIFEGNVVLTQGTTTLRCAKLVVTQDAAGFQRGIASGGPNGLAHIRQKREGSDEFMDGEGMRIEHDTKLEQTELFSRAWVRSGKDEVRGEYVFMDNKTGNYNASSGPNNTTPPGARVRAVIQPKANRTSAPVAPQPAGKTATQLPGSN